MSAPCYISDDDPLAMGVIVPGSTGVVWWNQTGGVTCQHKSCEGTWVRLGTTPDWLPDWFYGAHYGWAIEGSFTEEIAASLEQALRRDLDIAWIKLDRTRLRSSLEAWAYVVIGRNGHPVLSSHVGNPAILVWKNCD